MYLKNIEIQSILNGSYLYVFVIFIVLLSVLIIALTRNMYKSFRSLGIVIGITGCITISISDILPMILNILSNQLGEYMAIINPVVNTFIEKLGFVGIVEIVIGVVLFIVSIIVKNTGSKVETE